MAKREKTVVSLPNERVGPLIAPGVSQAASDKALAYTVGVQARLGSAGLPKVNMPVAGGAGPHIPHLAGTPGSEGSPRTMAQHAEFERGGAQVAVGGIVQPGGAPTRAPAANMDIRPGDLLPERAQHDPAFVSGQGSMYASAQPNLAAKYGVVRGSQIVPPQRLHLQTPGQAHLSPGTLQGLQELANAQKTKSPPPAVEAEEPIDPTRASTAAATVGNAAGDRDPSPISEEEKRRLEQSLKNADQFQFSEWRNAMLKDMLNSDEQKKIIDSRLQPLDITDLLNRGYIRQRIPIVPSKFEITLQSYDGVHDLALKRLIMQESKSVDATEKYLLDKYSFYGLAVGLHAVNDKVYPDCIDAKGDFNDDLFLEKFDQVIRLNIHVLASIGVNIMWFEQRVRRLCRAESLGNG